jgi:putative ABC transport system permease protein
MLSISDRAGRLTRLRAALRRAFRRALRLFASLPAAVPLALKQLRSSPGPTAGVAAGLVAAVVLATAVPLYADGVSRRVLAQQLAGEEVRPPFAFLFQYVGAWHGPLEWEDVQAADGYLTARAARDLRLPAAPVVRHVATEKKELLSAEGGAYSTAGETLAWVTLGFLDGLADHADVVEGALLPGDTGGGDVPVLVSTALANRLGLQVGETLLLDADALVRLRVAGVWQARDDDPAYWVYPPRAFEDALLTTEAAFRGVVAPAVRGEVGRAAWYLVADGSSVTTGDVPALLGRIAALRARLDGLLANVSLDYSPEEPLQLYRRESVRLTLLLYVFGIPVMGLVLAFVALVAGMAARRQQGQTVVLRSRGGTRGQVLAFHLLQWALLGIGALLLGWPLGWLAATGMGFVRSFLSFGGEGFVAPVDWASLRYGCAAVGAAVLAALAPSLAVARHTVVTHQQALARALRRPWWQRAFLDVALLVPATYGYVLLRRPAGLPLARLAEGDLFGNPLLFLAPALFIFAWALVLLRLLPRLMDLLARLSRRARGPVGLLVFQDLASQAGRIAGPLLLLVLTAALATFSASLALTLDDYLDRQATYRAGADMRLAEMGEPLDEGSGAMPAGGDLAPAGGESDSGWVFLPISEHLELPGVRAAARAGSYPASVSLGGRVENGRFLGVDRLDLPGVAFFRADFSPEPLVGLMNRLAGDPHALLVERRFVARHGLRVGDPLRVMVDVGGGRVEAEYTVAGVLDLFPTLYPEDGPFFVGHLRTLFLRAGGIYPYDVWLATEPGSSEEIVQALNGRGVPVVRAWDARGLIAEEQRLPQRQGLFGLLTLGFVASALLTVAGLALHALLSFRERTVELGVLRALGLSLSQMRAYLAGVQVALLLVGLLAGTALGVVAGRLFLPFLRVESVLHPDTPPFVVHTAWGDIALVYVLFGAMAALSTWLTLDLLRRMRVHEAIKMGETL